MARFLFSSSSKENGGVFLLDSQSGEARRLFQGSSRGLTLGPDGWFYVVSGYRNPLEGSSTIHRIQPGSWSVEPVTELHLGDCHDLRWLDGHFYLVASLGNQIVRLDAECRPLDRMQVVEDDRDICHVNCIAQAGGELYSTIFTLSPGERAEKRYTDAWFNEGKVVRLDFAARGYSVVYEPLSQPHSLFAGHDGLYLVESHRSCVTRVDPRTGERKVLGEYTGFLRGMGVGPNEVMLGASLMYRKDRKRRRPLSFLRGLSERLRPFAGLLVVDAKTWRVRRRLSVPGAEVYDVLYLDEG